MCLELVVPFVHSVNLELIVSLTAALRNVALGPLSETGCDLLNTDRRVLGFVTIPFIVRSSLEMVIIKLHKFLFK